MSSRRRIIKDLEKQRLAAFDRLCGRYDKSKGANRVFVLDRIHSVLGRPVTAREVEECRADLRRELSRRFRDMLREGEDSKHVQIETARRLNDGRR